METIKYKFKLGQAIDKCIAGKKVKCDHPDLINAHMVYTDDNFLWINDNGKGFPTTMVSLGLFPKLNWAVYEDRK